MCNGLDILDTCTVHSTTLSLTPVLSVPYGTAFVFRLFLQNTLVIQAELTV